MAFQQDAFQHDAVQTGLPDSATDQPSTASRNRMAIRIACTWAAMVATPLYAAVLLQPVVVDAPPPTHGGRTAVKQSGIVQQWDTTWNAQWRVKLPQESTVTGNDPPPEHEGRAVGIQASIVGQWGLTWDAQQRPKLVQEGAAVSPVLRSPWQATAQYPYWATPQWDTQRRTSIASSVSNQNPVFGKRPDTLMVTIRAWDSTWVGQPMIVHIAVTGGATSTDHHHRYRRSGHR